jgi:hypothetical protein
VSITKKTKGYKTKGGVDVPYTVWTDDKGNLREEELPVRIEIVQKPVKTQYRAGDKINIVGIGVRAYRQDGSEWSSNQFPLSPWYARGEIPAIELSFEPTVAETETGYISDLGEKPVVVGLSPWRGYFDSDSPRGDGVDGGTIAISIISPVGLAYGVASKEPFTATLFSVSSAGTRTDTGTREAGVYTHNGKMIYTVGYLTSAGWYKSYNVPVNYFSERTDNISGVAWTALWGDKVGGTSEVTVTWDMNGELDEPLTDKYKITVSSASGGNSGGGGSSGGGSDIPVTPPSHGEMQ